MPAIEWRPVGLVVIGRRSSDLELVAGGVRARITATPRRVVVEMVSGCALTALAAGHRLVASVLDEVAGGEGWMAAEPSIRQAARVVVQGASAASAVAPFFGGAADVVLGPVRASGFDPYERAREKAASREADAHAIATGEKTVEQVRSENSAFAFKNVRIRLPARER